MHKPDGRPAHRGQVVGGVRGNGALGKFRVGEKGWG